MDDVDPSTGLDAGDDLVTQFNTGLVNLSISTAFVVGDYIGGNDIGLLRLSFRVTCTENFYGSDCATLCVERDDELGHYTCDSKGNIVCREGFQNPSTNCTECILAEGCCKSMYLQISIQVQVYCHSCLCICIMHATALLYLIPRPFSSLLVTCSMNMEGERVQGMAWE